MPDSSEAWPDTLLLSAFFSAWGPGRLPERVRSLKLFVIGRVSASGPVGA